MLEFQNHWSVWVFLDLDLIIFLNFIYLFIAVPCGLQDVRSQTRDWTQALAVKAQNPNHKAARELPVFGYWIS